MRPEGTKYVIIQSSPDRFGLSRLTSTGTLQSIGSDSLKTLKEAEKELGKILAKDKFETVARYYDADGKELGTRTGV